MTLRLAFWIGSAWVGLSVAVTVVYAWLRYDPTSVTPDEEEWRIQQELGDRFAQVADPLLYRGRKGARAGQQRQF